MQPKKEHFTNFIGYFFFIARQKISVHASYTAYFMILSFFPSLVLLLSILRYTGLQVETLIGLLDGLLPAALMPAAEKLILSTYTNTTGAVVSFSAVTALWSASRGLYGLLTGLNTIYQVSENRGYLYTRTISVLYTFLFLLVLLLTLVLHVFGNTLLSLLPFSDSVFFHFLTEAIDFRFLMLLLLQTGLFTAIFMFLPNKRNKLAQSLPGALLSSMGWLLFSDLYSIYVEHVSNYTTIYGSVYVVALSMLWLYCCMFIVFCGGALNQYLMQKRSSSIK